MANASLAVTDAPDGRLVLALSGRLVADTIPGIWRDALSAVRGAVSRPVTVDASGVDYCDGAGIALLGAAFVDWALVAVHVGRSGLLDEAGGPGLYAVAMGLDGAAAYACGHAYDRAGLRVLVLAALVLAVAGVLVLAVPGLWAMITGIALWAIALGGLESVAKAAIATLVPKPERGAAYGRFYAVLGVSWWAGSVVLGLAYDASPAASGVVVAVLAAAAAAVLSRVEVAAT